ncbi:MAG TPA: serine/threonine-protein kinase [Myxococcota bacterium]|nr:serine/threonine-protein kinase [Myxococcota bacterium]
MSPVQLDDPAFARAAGAAGHDSGRLLGQIIGNYQVAEYLGAGAMGSVYLARHTRIGQEVAFKILHRHLASDQRLVQRFEAEARAVARAGHRNIVQVFDFGELPDKRSFFVMELLRGRSLRRMMEVRGALEPRFALAIAREVALALAAAHRAGVVHRDLKPDNVFMLEEDARKPALKVLDFGIAKLQGDQKSVGLTETGMVYGTPQYIAPEQAEGLVGLDGRADLYALGVMLFEMLTGVLPFTGGPGDLLAAHVFKEPPDPRTLKPELPDALAELVLRLLRKKAEERFETGDELVGAIDGIGLTTAHLRAVRRSATAPGGPTAVAAPPMAAASPRMEPPRNATGHHTDRSGPVQLPVEASASTTTPDFPAMASATVLIDRRPDTAIAEAVGRSRSRTWISLGIGLAAAAATVALLAVVFGGDDEPRDARPRPARSAAAAGKDDRAGDEAAKDDRTAVPADEAARAAKDEATAAAKDEAPRSAEPGPPPVAPAMAPKTGRSLAVDKATAAPRSAAAARTAAPKSDAGKKKTGKPGTAKIDSVLRPSF